MSVRSGILKGIFSPKTISRASTREDLSVEDDDQGDNTHVDEHSSDSSSEHEDLPHDPHQKDDASAGRDAFRRRKKAASKKLNNTALGQALLPILHSLYLVGEKLQVEMPDLDDITTKVEKAIGSANVASHDGITTNVMHALYQGPLDPEVVVEPPPASFFARTDYFHPRFPQRYNVMKHVFTCPTFHGNSKDTITVEQFLECITEGAFQLAGELSENDFRNILKSKTTGPARQSLSLWLKNQGYSLQAIYHKMLSTFDNREDADEAEEKLNTLESTAFSSLPAMIQRIELLARRASLQMRGLQNQETLFNKFATATLLRLLPSPYKETATSFKLQLEQAKANSLSFHSVVLIVEKWSREITRILRQKYVGKPKWSKNGKQQFQRQQSQYAQVSVVEGEGERGSSTGRSKALNYSEALDSSSAPSGEQLTKWGPRYDRRKQKQTVASVQATDSTPRVQQKWQTKTGQDDPPHTYTHGEKEGVCVKCKGRHASDSCQLVEGPIASYACTRCDLNAFHYARHCPFFVARGEDKQWQQTKQVHATVSQQQKPRRVDATAAQKQTTRQAPSVPPPATA